MWPRVIEAMLALWLAVSPFVFSHPERPRLWAVDFAAAAAIFVLAMLSLWDRARRAHLGSLAVAVALLVVGYIGDPGPPSGASQNRLVVGLLLLMIAILPTDSDRPPVKWRRFYGEQSPLT